MSTIFSRSGSVWLRLILILVVVSVGAGRLYGQQGTGTIAGTVTDPSGAALVGATVQATNVGTSLSQSSITDSNGRYVITTLRPGTYNVQSSMAGFKTVIHEGIILAVGNTLVSDFTLPVGQVSQTVSVEANVTRVETQDSTVSTLVSPEQMRDLPLNGRNWEQLITLTPGVTTIAPTINLVTGRLYGMQDNYSVSGSRPTGQAWLMDSQDVRDFWEHGTGSGYAGTSLGVEAIGEFRVLTNTYTAQFAGNGVVINTITRSGTNNFHGGAYEFYRNNALDARDVLDPASGPPPFERNQFGAAVGGPIKKDKLFFFANFEGLREDLHQTYPIALPEPYVGSGQLPCGAPGAPMFAPPFPGAPFEAPNLVNSSAPACLAALVPGGTWGPVSGVGTGANPVEAVAPVAAGGALAAANLTRMSQIASLYSLCNTGCRATSGDLGGYYSGTAAPDLSTYEYYVMGRLDYVLGQNDTMYGRYVFDNADIGDGTRDLTGIFPETDFTRNQFFTIAEKHVFSPTLLNEARFSFSRVKEQSTVPLFLSSAQLAAAGLTSDPLDWVRTANGGAAAGWEDAQIGPDYLATITPIGPDPNRPDNLIQMKYTEGDDVVWIKGAHTIRFGVSVSRVDTNNVQSAYANGPAAFLVFSLQNFLQGLPYADYAVPPGYISSTRYFREIDVAPYIQDDWKVTPKLTLNFGLRYDYGTNPVGWSTPYIGPNGQTTTSLTAVTASFNPPIGALTPPTFVPGNFATLFTPVHHVFLNSPNTANWGPRFGFAFNPSSDNKTVIRGGWGIFYDPTAARIYESGYIATPPAASFELIGSFPGAPNSPCVPNPFAVVPGYCGATLPAPGEFAGVSYLVPHGSPYVMQYNLNVQREVMRDTVLTVGYVGSVGRHLWLQRDINIPECFTYPNCTALPSIKAPNSGVCFASTSTLANGTVVPGCNPAATTAVIEPRINTNYGTLVEELNTIPSNYNSLQVSLNRHFAKNFAGSVNYTYSHCFDEGSFATSLEEFQSLLVDAYNQKYDYGNCLFDQRNNFSLNGLYALPFKGNQFVQGWQLATILGIHNGVPINVTNNIFTGPTDLGTQWSTRPNYTFAAGCNPNQLVQKSLNNAPGTELYQWFNPDCYVPQTDGYLGNVIRDNMGGPGAIGWDFSILKNTLIKERFNVQFRAEFFNIINHFNPAPPGPTSSLDTTFGLAGTGQSQGSQAPVVTPRQIQFAVKMDF
ncbi:MAG TPA: carboxypeptidase regulatory-like domain-containing protein [Candidatus Acidoferrales bacterium]|nr:carboxypeptidase regulatory-like domain-containing protein [Candidatus Acidoferrales bacterium]